MELSLRLWWLYATLDTIGIGLQNYLSGKTLHRVSQRERDEGIMGHLCAGSPQQKITLLPYRAVEFLGGWIRVTSYLIMLVKTVQGLGLIFR
jgi:hypothetical protein